MTGRAIIRGDDGIKRCWWCVGHDDYMDYHDHEWGRPVVDDARLLEKICLEGFQCGLSWLTILRKRDRFREVFHGFDPEAVAAMGTRDVTRLLKDAGIVRHRGKIESTMNNARAALSMMEASGSLAAWLWDFAPPRRRKVPRVASDIPSATDESKQLSRALKKHGWSYVGPTTVYAFMQATGMTNDHVSGCVARAEVEAKMRRFRPPAASDR